MSSRLRAAQFFFLFSAAVAWGQTPAPAPAASPAASMSPAPAVCSGAQGFISVDLRSKFPPLRDQGGLGICSAFGTADQVNYAAIQAGIPGISTQDENYVSAIGAQIDSNNEMRAAALGKADALSTKPARIAAERERLAKDLASLQQQLDGLLDELGPATPALASAYSAWKQLDLQVKTLQKNPDHDPAKLKKLRSDAAHLRDALIDKSMDDRRFRPLMEREIRDDQELRELGKFSMFIFEETTASPPDYLMNGMFQNGFCLENEVSSFDHTISLEEIIEDRFNGYVNDPKSADVCRTAEGLQKLFRTHTVDEVADLLKRIHEVDPLAELMDNCKRYTFSPDKRPVVVSKSIPKELTKEAAFQLIDQLLEASVPVGVGYNGYLLNYRDPKAIERAAKSDPEIREHKWGGHYSLLVGKRFNCKTGRREYIVRDSMGKGECSSLHDNFTTDENTKDSLELNGHIAGQRKSACMDKCDDLLSAKAKEGKAYEVLDATRACEKECVHAYDEEMAKIPEPPFTCELGYYVLDEAQLALGILNLTYAK